jgi:uncharacterized protein YbjT (DUF2867 family)
MAISIRDFGQTPADLMCEGLPSDPRADLGTILVTGASGYIGGRLVPELVARGYKIRAMVRGDVEPYQDIWPSVEVVSADALNLEHLKRALEGVEVAYYLIHSLFLGLKEFEYADLKAAGNFRIAAEQAGIKRIIYLGGLGDKRARLSSHLKSRIEVANELIKAKIPITILRAAVIIGSGSASYEIINNLVKRLPLILIPPWAENKCQPISIRDVIKYLVGVLEVPETSGKYFDIGGADVLDYEHMLIDLAEIISRRTMFVHTPLSMISFHAYLVSLITPVPNNITQCLMRGLVDEVICRDDSIKNYLPFQTMTYKEAIVRAMSREEQDRVYTRWSDAYPPAHELALKLNELPQVAYVKRYAIDSPKPASALFNSICKIGGKEGWFNNNWMWRLRGGMDRLILGIGSSRGRKSYKHLEVNDVIDFWRIEDIKKDRRLLLRAEMKLPGKAWLEFRIKENDSSRELSTTAYFDTHSLFGKIYWMIFLPFHHFIFKKLIMAIFDRS